MIQRYLAATVVLAVALATACNEPEPDATANFTGPFEKPPKPAGMVNAITHDTYTSTFETEPVQDGKPPVLE